MRNKACRWAETASVFPRLPRKARISLVSSPYRCPGRRPDVSFHVEKSLMSSESIGAVSNSKYIPAPNVAIFNITHNPHSPTRDVKFPWEIALFYVQAALLIVTLLVTLSHVILFRETPRAIFPKSPSSSNRTASAESRAFLSSCRFSG